MSAIIYPYQNKDLTIEKRVADLMSRMTLEEKIAQLGCSMWNPSLPEDQQALILENGIGQISTSIFGNVGGAKDVAQTVIHIQKYLVERTRLAFRLSFMQKQGYVNESL